MNSTEWTPEQRRRIALFTESKNPSDLAGEIVDKRGLDANGPVPLTACRAWRTRLREHPEHDSKTLAAADDETFAPNTIRKHAYGRCSHPDAAAGDPADGERRRGGPR